MIILLNPAVESHRDGHVTGILAVGKGYVDVNGSKRVRERGEDVSAPRPDGFTSFERLVVFVLAGRESVKLNTTDEPAEMPKITT